MFATLTTTTISTTTTKSSGSSITNCPAGSAGICKNGGQCLLINSISIICGCQTGFTGYKIQIFFLKSFKIENICL